MRPAADFQITVFRQQKPQSLKYRREVWTKSTLYTNVVFAPTNFRMLNIPNNSDPKQAPCQE
jgi:hypothetical protein